jgi:hypothetical protein
MGLIDDCSTSYRIIGFNAFLLLYSYVGVGGEGSGVG